jgi:hypothetical protein
LQFDSVVFSKAVEDIREQILARLLRFEWGPGGPPPALREAIGQRQVFNKLLGAQRREQQAVADARQILFRTEILKVLQKESRDTPDVLRGKLRDENPLSRRVAIQVIASRRLPLETDLIARLDDPDVGVQQMARQTLVLLGRGTDFGPVAKAGKAERAKAIQKWTEWLALQREAAPEPVVHRIATAADKALSLPTLQGPALVAAKDAEEARIASLSNLLVKASGTRQDEVLRRLQTADGEHHTQALARAIPHLSGDIQDRARRALTERFARLSTSALRDKLQDEAAEVRRAAAKACAILGEKSLVSDLRRLAEDADKAVAEAARAALAEIAPGGP